MNTTGRPRIRFGSGSKRFALALAAAMLLCGLSVVLACMFGPYPVPAADVLHVILTHAGLLPDASATVASELANAVGDGTTAHTALKNTVTGSISGSADIVVWNIRLSRITLSMLTGGALAVAGTVFQGILRNPLADPFTLGVSSGAAFGASLAIWAGATGAATLVTGVSILPFAAMAGALLALGAVIILGRSGGRLRRETLVLAGVVVSSFLAALISLVKSLDEESVASIVFWIMGSFQGRGWQHVALVLPWFTLGGLLIWRWSRELDILALGEVQAKQLGMNAARTRLLLLIGASLLTGAAVSVSGVIGFVGLVVPHLVRMVQGGEHRPLLATSAFAGGLLLLWSDVLARTILPDGAELPVGVVTALLGGPFFCFLLRKSMREQP